MALTLGNRHRADAVETASVALGGKERDRESAMPTSNRARRRDEWNDAVRPESRVPSGRIGV